jgi:hypothetical protein
MVDGCASTCTFVTRKGLRCTRKCAQGTACWQHLPLPKHECAICLETVGHHKRFKLECTHVFHKQCIARWVRKDGESCPLCRNTITDYEHCILGVKRCTATPIDITRALIIIDLLEELELLMA